MLKDEIDSVLTQMKGIKDKDSDQYKSLLKTLNALMSMAHKSDELSFETIRNGQKDMYQDEKDQKEQERYDNEHWHGIPKSVLLTVGIGAIELFGILYFERTGVILSKAFNRLPKMR